MEQKLFIKEEEGGAGEEERRRPRPRRDLAPRRPRGSAGRGRGAAIISGQPDRPSPPKPAALAAPRLRACRAGAAPRSGCGGREALRAEGWRPGGGPGRPADEPLAGRGACGAAPRPLAAAGAGFLPLVPLGPPATESPPGPLPAPGAPRHVPGPALGVGADLQAATPPGKPGRREGFAPACDAAVGPAVP